MRRFASPPFVVALGLVAVAAFPAASAGGQGPVARAVPPEGYPVPGPVLAGFDFRMVGPSRGGRVTTVAGAPSEPHVFYMGSTGGGVWRTENAGMSWTNLSDGHFAVGSIGAVEVAPSDPNVIWVGTGSACPRGNVSVGNGVYRSTDRGRSFHHVGLPASGLIGRIRAHPDDPDIAFVAVLGQIFGRSDERGVYRTTDGGATWEAVLQISDRTGAVDLAMNPENPRELFAAMWTAERKPWTLVDGSSESGLYRTRDGGDSWTLLRGGLPEAAEEAPVGRIGVSLSASRPNRVYALVTAGSDRGGLYRSEDAGDSWRRVNGDRRLRSRGWYYSHVVADPGDADTVYVLNAPFLRSVDGGVSFAPAPVPHGDNHDLWINPNDSRIMVEANDGGATVTLDGGETWSSIHNQPTAEFYRLTLDDGFPRRLYGAQQDNSTISVPAWTDHGLSPESHWRSVAGGESGHIAVTPGRPGLTYAGNYIGRIDRLDQDEAGARNVILWPELADGVAPVDLRYRFQWNAPILIPPHDPGTVYHASNFIHRSRDGGNSWETISPDLSAGDPEKQQLPGGPVQHDHTGVEVYGSVFALAASARRPGVFWAGTDDGRVHVSRDDGATWTDVTPAEFPPGGTVNSIDPSPHRDGGATIAAYRYRENDFAPYVFRTADFGAAWTALPPGSGIPSDHPARVVREDPEREGLLFAGTEFGLFLSLDGGASFAPFGDLPAVPVTDLRIAEDSLYLATQGRSFWVLDDLTPVRALGDESGNASWDAPALLPAGRATLLATGGARPFRGPGAPENRPAGALLHYFLPEDVPDGARLVLTISGEDGGTVRTLAGKPAPGARSPTGSEGPGGGGSDRPDPDAVLGTGAGLHRAVWDLKYERPELVPGSVMSISYTGGSFVLPGRFSASLSVEPADAAAPGAHGSTGGNGVPGQGAGNGPDDDGGAGGGSTSVAVAVVPDPRAVSTPVEDLRAQHDLVRNALRLLERIHERIGALRDARAQIGALEERLRKADLWSDAMEDRAETLLTGLGEVEEALIQTRNEAPQDPINFPPKLDNQVAYLYGHAARNYGRPTAGSVERLSALEAEAAPLLERLSRLLGEDLAGLDGLLREAGVPSGVLPGASSAGPGGSRER